MKRWQKGLLAAVCGLTLIFVPVFAYDAWNDARIENVKTYNAALDRDCQSNVDCKLVDYALGCGYSSLCHSSSEEVKEYSTPFGCNRGTFDDLSIRIKDPCRCVQNSCVMIYDDSAFPQ